MKKFQRLLVEAERTISASKAYRFIKSHNNSKGEGFVDTLVKMLIVVVIGAALLALLNAAIPGLFNDMIAKIRTTFGL